jgi:hypothetical protein
MKDWNKEYRYCCKKVETIDGRAKRTYEKWFDTLEDAIDFRDALLE